MIKVEILKNNTPYVLDFMGGETLQEAYDAAKNVAEGREYFKTEDGVLDLGTSDSYQHIRAWVEADPVIVEPPTAVEELKSKYFETVFFDRISFLGNTVTVRGVKATVGDCRFILVHEVDNTPALFLLQKSSLEKLAEHVAAIQWIEKSEVIIQAADLSNNEEAIEYMVDYLDDLVSNAEHIAQEDFTAVAYPGLNDNEKGRTQ